MLISWSETLQQLVENWLSMEMSGYRPKQAQRLMGESCRAAFKARKVTEDIEEMIDVLIRQDLPKGTDFNKVNDIEIEFVMDRRDNRQTASRGGRSPN